MTDKKVEIGYSVQLTVRQIDSENSINLYDMFEVCITEKDIIESSGFFHENLIHFLETRVFKKKK